MRPDQTHPPKPRSVARGEADLIRPDPTRSDLISRASEQEFSELARGLDATRSAEVRERSRAD
ncbi:MAG TPA: hypothetical protein VIL25_11025 [Vicinamibacterales bacterium]